MDWGEIFFILHRYCNLNKWEIWEYTLPQITELMKRANRYIQFEINIHSMPLSVVGASPSVPDGYEQTGGKSNNDDDEYHIATEDDIMALSQLLGG